MADTGKWQVVTNDLYLRIVSVVVSLSTGALVLPLLFIRDFMGVPAGQPIAHLLASSAWVGWWSLVAAVALGLAYSWLSVKWVKSSFGQATFIPGACLERLCDALFVLMMIAFLVGVAAIAFFLLRG